LKSDYQKTQNQNPMNSQFIALAMFAIWLFFPNQLKANDNVLVIGSDKDTGGKHHSGVSWTVQKPAYAYTSNSEPFSPAGGGTRLQNNLAQDSRDTVNVTVLDSYRADAITARSLWAQIHKGYPALSLMREKTKTKREFTI
jgi:hypothetical protein